MKNWLPALKAAIQAGRASTLVTIADARGSAPREAGVKMLVTLNETAGTVGGGNLEHEAIRIARSMLREGAEQSSLRQFALGPSLGQCCGGNTKLLFEPFPAGTVLPAWIDELISMTSGTTPSALVSAIDRRAVEKLIVRPEEANTGMGGEDQTGWDGAVIEQAQKFFDRPGNASARLWRSGTGELFFLEQNPEGQGPVLLIGAGHVGKAMASVLAPLPFRLTWADNRPEQFPEEIAPTIRVVCTPHLDKAVDEAAAGTIYLVMTYSHDLDYALCARILQRGDFRYLGLIGSKTKRARFEKTMTNLGIDQALTDRVVCPIGIEGISSKQPSVIAVATAAQLLALPPFHPSFEQEDAETGGAT